MGDPARPDDERSMVQELRQRVAGGEYTVDPHAVAEAILSRRPPRTGLASLCSEMLVAAQLSAGGGQGDSVTRDDPA